MKRSLGTLAAVIMLFSLLMMSGCARQGMNGSKDGSMDTMSEEKMDSGKGTGGEDAMPGAMKKMQENDMEKTMQ